MKNKYKNRDSFELKGYQIKWLIEDCPFTLKKEDDNEDQLAYKEINALYTVIKNKITDAGYKNSSTHSVILKRNTDDKFFKGEYTYYHAADKYSDKEAFEEVFPKQVTKTIYK